MVDALALEDLALVVLYFGAFILAALAFYLASAITGAINIHIPGVGHPFAGIAGAMQNAIVSPLHALMKSSEAGIAKGLSGLVDSLAVIIAIPLLLALGIKAAFQYLWNHALAPFVAAAVRTIRRDATAALNQLTTLSSTVAADLTRAEHYAETQAAKALGSARSYAETQARSAYHDAVSYADEAVSKLRTAENAAIEHAVRLADAAKTAGEAAALNVEHAVEADIARATAEAEAFGTAALGEVRSIAIGAEHGLTDFEQYVKNLDLAKTIAGSAALAGLVALVLAETGLENQACRSKVKDICRTDPAKWGALLAGLGVAGLALDFGDIVKASVGLAKDAEGALNELGHVAVTAENDAARAIADAARSIAPAAIFAGV
jgi:hypothetical protein